MKKVFLVNITHAWGERLIENKEIENKYDLPLGWILEKTGKKKGHAWAGPNSLAMASKKCLSSLLKRAKVQKTQIKAIFGTTNSKIKGSQFLTPQFIEKIGFNKNITTFDESFGCGGPAIGINHLYHWFQNQPDNTYAVYLTGDWATSMARTRNLETILSDGVSVSLWTNGQGGIMELGNIFCTDTIIKEEHLGIFDGFWVMNGQKVSEAVFAIPGIIAKELDIDLKDYDIAPHQANAKLLEEVEKFYGIPLYKEIVREHGNPTPSGGFMAMEMVIKERKLKTERNKGIVVMLFGAGGMGGFILKEPNN